MNSLSHKSDGLVKKILIIYSSTDGQTRKISESMQQTLQAENVIVKLVSISTVCADNLKQSDVVVIGASVRYGKHKKEVFEFVLQHKALLTRIPTAFFSVSLIARKSNRDTPETNPYIKKFMVAADWTPTLSAVFAGKLNYPKYGFLDRLMIRLIMYLTNGPTDPNVVKEYTDWSKVTDFSQLISKI